MADVFEWRSDLVPWRKRLWELITRTPNLDWLLLTKRPHLIRRLSPWKEEWPPNVWVGTTVESQTWAKKRIHHLADVPARIRFLSCEPLLGPVDLERFLEHGAIDWVIAGGESGPKARHSDPEWFRRLRDQCNRHSVPFHFKQWGDWAPCDSVRCQLIPSSTVECGKSAVTLGRFGKKLSGRLLDGRTWDGLPQTVPLK
jgi:protein gp37